MKLRELNDENKSKSHGNMARSTSAYGDNKYVAVLLYYKQLTKTSSGKKIPNLAAFVRELLDNMAWRRVAECSRIDVRQFWRPLNFKSLDFNS